MGVRERLVERIRRHGPLPFEAFMEVALYDPDGGFFTTGGLRSDREGDFLTSPEVSPLFGEAIGNFVTEEWERLDRPREFSVCDAGAGSGSLLEPLVATLPFRPAVYAVEVSPAARASLERRVPKAQVLSGIEELPSAVTGVVVANEMFDNLPMAIAVRRGDEWMERMVGAAGGALSWVEAPARPDVQEWLDRWSAPVDEGGVVEVQMAATREAGRLLDRLTAGSLVVFDYGDTAAGLAERRPHGTVRTYRGHHLGPDALDEPGHTDITADVNFTALAEECTGRGAACRVARQDEVLTEWGLADRRAELRRRELEAARRGEGLERLAARSRIVEIDTLLHPRGLGDFRVLIARKPGTPPR